jgi:hypothetical protein
MTFTMNFRATTVRRSTLMTRHPLSIRLTVAAFLLIAGCASFGRSTPPNSLREPQYPTTDWRGRRIRAIADGRVHQVEEALFRGIVLPKGYVLDEYTWTFQPPALLPTRLYVHFDRSVDITLVLNRRIRVYGWRSSPRGPADEPEEYPASMSISVDSLEIINAD